MVSRLTSSTLLVSGATRVLTRATFTTPESQVSIHVLPLPGRLCLEVPRVRNSVHPKPNHRLAPVTWSPILVNGTTNPISDLRQKFGINPIFPPLPHPTYPNASQVLLFLLPPCSHQALLQAPVLLTSFCLHHLNRDGYGASWMGSPPILGGGEAILNLIFKSINLTRCVFP